MRKMRFLNGLLASISRKGKGDPREYFKVMPANDYEYDWKAAREFPCRLPEPRKRAGTPRLSPALSYRFLAHVSGGKVTLYFGCPPGEAGAVRSAFAGVYPKVSLSPAASPVTSWEGGAAAELYAKGGPWLPLARLDGKPSSLAAALSALGAGKHAAHEAVLDVCFWARPTEEVLARAEREAAKLSGMLPGSGSLAELAAQVKEALSSPALGGKNSGGYSASKSSAVQKYKELKVLRPSQLALAEEVRDRFRPPERAFEVTVRVAARGGPPGAAEQAVKDAVANLRRLGGHNRLEMSGRFAPDQRVAAGLAGERLLMNSSELACLLAIPGPDTSAWPYLERDVARTVAPPPWMLGKEETERS